MAYGDEMTDEERRRLEEEQFAADQPPGITVGTEPPPDNSGASAEPIPEVAVRGVPVASNIPYLGGLPQTNEQPGYSAAGGDFSTPAYQGQAFPGLPVIVNQGEGPSYNGQDYNTLGEAMAARAAHAASPQAQATYAAAQQARPAPQPGDAVTPEMTSIQMREQLDRTQLSPSDQLELTQIQNGIQRVQRDTREGRVPLTQAQQLIQQLEGRANPLMIRQSTANAVGQLLHRQILQEQAEHAQIIGARRNAFFAANAPGSVIEHRDSTGRSIGQSVVGVDEQSHYVPPRPDTEAARTAAADERRAAATERRNAQVEDHFARQVAHNVDTLTRQQADPLSPPEIRALTPEQINQRAIDQARVVTTAYRRSLEAATGSGEVAPASGSQQVASNGAGQGTPPAAARVPGYDRPPVVRPVLEQRQQPSDVPVDRVQALRAIAEDSLAPTYRRPDSVMAFDPRRPMPTDAEDLQRAMYGILRGASEAQRPLTRDEKAYYESAQRELERRSPIRGELLDIQEAPVQRAYAAPAARIVQIRDEAARVYQNTSRWTSPFLRGDVGDLVRILDKAANENRPLSRSETAQYLQSWSILSRRDHRLADDLQLHR